MICQGIINGVKRHIKILRPHSLLPDRYLVYYYDDAGNTIEYFIDIEDMIGFDKKMFNNKQGKKNIKNYPKD